MAFAFLGVLLFSSYPAGFVRASLPASTLFLSHFDGTTRNERNGSLGTSSGLSFVTGKFSKGVRFDSTDYLYYSASGNINPLKGTVEFWYKPSDN